MAANTHDTAQGSGPQPATTRSAGRVAPLGRAGTLTAAAAVLFAAAAVFTPIPASAATAPVPENAAARASILQSVATQPDPSVIPADFAAEEGYQPVVRDGMLINPNGDCSSPVPLPSEFDLACKAHDLGYDLLRYASSHGQPLGPWARQTADAGLERRMHAACADRTDAVSYAQCQVMAGIATTAVDLNSIRQGYGVPIYESFFEPEHGHPSEARMLCGAGALAVLTAGLATAARVILRNRRTTRTAPHAAAVPL
ncbi:hypothetical protein ACIP5Y_04355 [Nocardia sp. NPDC088792]|uniref:hypothetical protein n=1 Tax=Nocardia sp. NPDC088792 TaxID=3364332 RepID=UPI0037F409AE